VISYVETTFSGRSYSGHRWVAKALLALAGQIRALHILNKEDA
jgi:hypothetical protein